jgi:poly-gamma-glutamate synthesis protein (capsule biosynthesis protein)
MPGRGLSGLPGLFDHVSARLQAADLVIGNLEGVLTPNPAASTSPSFPASSEFAGAPALPASGWPPPSPLLIPPQAIPSLAAAGFDLLTLANNHALDAGQPGLEYTASALQSAGLQPLLSAQPQFRQLAGLKLGFLAWNALATADDTQLFAALRQLRPAADIVIILVHWGQEYQRHPNLPQRALAERLFAAGADLILGSHPHVVQDVQLVHPPGEAGRPRLAAYSLGNFAFDQGWDDTGQGLALRLLFDSAGLRAAQALPLWTSPRPRWMTTAEAAPLLERLLPERRLGFICTTETCRSVLVPQERRSGLFWSGAIDLTGDGRPELVHRLARSVEIYQAGLLAWSSPPEWRILDLALGDPNDDGRHELLLALEKTAASGETTHHPFIVGYRRGSYRVLWGGSPVSAPLYEVELADLDGDGADELAAIEASQDGAARHVTVWRWHGWGFSLLWRSPLGGYHDLVILPGEKGAPARVSVGE